MKRFAKVMSVLLALAMITACFAACGDKTSQNDDKKPGESQNAGDSSAKAFKLGLTGPLTGENAIYGVNAANGAKIAVDEINALGGNIKFEWRAEDDQSQEEPAVNAYNALMDWGMQIFIGSVTSGSAKAATAIAKDDRVFTLTPSASSADVIDGKDNVFQVCFTDPNQGVASADYMAEHYKDEKIAVIYRNDDPYSQGIFDTFKAEAAAKGLDVVYEGTFTKDTATDFSVQLTAAQSKEATVIFLPIYYDPASVIFNQANQMNYKPVFFGVDGMDGILTMKNFDTSLAEGVFLLTPFAADAKDEKTQAFVAKYKELHGETPNQFAADGYDAVYAVYETIKKTGATSDMSNADLCAKLIEGITSITFDGLTGQGMTWKESGEVSKAPMAVVIKDGVYVTPDAE